MEFHIVIPVLISFAISTVLGPVIIPFLRKLKMGQTERTEGVQSHLKKAGTPTMGGVIFLISTVITSLFYVKDYPKIIPVLFLTLGFGLIGFLDDYLKNQMPLIRQSPSSKRNMVTMYSSFKKVWRVLEISKSSSQLTLLQPRML